MLNTSLNFIDNENLSSTTKIADSRYKIAIVLSIKTSGKILPIRPIRSNLVNFFRLVIWFRSSSGQINDHNPVRVRSEFLIGSQTGKTIYGLLRTRYKHKHH